MSDTRNVGISLDAALFLVFVVLRLTDHIKWAWYWVASPIWIPVAAYIAVLGLVTMFVVPIELITDSRKAARARHEWRVRNGVPKL